MLIFLLVSRPIYRHCSATRCSHNDEHVPHNSSSLPLDVLRISPSIKHRHCSNECFETTRPVSHDNEDVGNRPVHYVHTPQLARYVNNPPSEVARRAYCEDSLQKPIMGIKICFPKPPGASRQDIAINLLTSSHQTQSSHQLSPTN